MNFKQNFYNSDINGKYHTLAFKQCKAATAAACSEYFLFFSHDSLLKNTPLVLSIDCAKGEEVASLHIVSPSHLIYKTDRNMLFLPHVWYIG